MPHITLFVGPRARAFPKLRAHAKSPGPLIHIEYRKERSSVRCVCLILCAYRTMRQVINTLRARVVSSGACSTEGGVNIVAFSGGVDSSLVAALVHEAFPRNSLACVGVSAALPEAQLQLARRVANHIGVPLSEVITGEGSNPQYIANEGQSCFYCKTHLYSALEAVAERAGKESLRPTADAVEDDYRTAGREDRRRVVLFNGTNKDDRRDPTRVGLKAAEEFQVASPIDNLSKNEVRAVSRELGLPNWNYAASPCLRSRLAFGVQATPERLVKVEKAEDVARRYLGLNVSHNLRVRAMHGEKALLEVDGGEVLEEAVRALPDMRRLILPLGFEELNVRAFRSGGLSGASPSVAPASQGRAAADGTRKIVDDGVEVSHVAGGGRSSRSDAERGEMPTPFAS